MVGSVCLLNVYYCILSIFSFKALDSQALINDFTNRIKWLGRSS